MSIVLGATLAMAVNFNNESLKYKVEYKWGLVNKTAGYVTVSLKNRSDRYVCNLAAHSAPWADKFYKVRDTLYCEVLKNGFLPVIYEKRSHEGGDHKLDVVKYSRSGGTTTGTCIRKVWEEDKLVKDEQRVLTATGTVVDMMSVFYYMRNLPYETWTKGKVHQLNIFSGKRKELLTITYQGIEDVKCDNKVYNCYHIKFKFTSDGKKKTSDDMDAWINTSGRRLPVRLEGALPIGKIRCFYTGG